MKKYHIIVKALTMAMKYQILISLILIVVSSSEENIDNKKHNCTTGSHENYKTTAYMYNLSPVSMNGVGLNSGGFYAVDSAIECCYSCASLASGLCTTWTYDGCGRCYLSSAT